MSEFKHLMKIYSGPMGGTTCVPVKPAGTYYGKDALTINYNNQILIVNMVELEKTIAAVRNHYKEKLLHVNKTIKEKHMMENGSYEIVSTVGTDSIDAWSRHYYVKIVNKRITKIGALLERENYSYWYYSSEDPVNLNQCKKFMTKCNGEEMHKKTVQRIMTAIGEHYPKFYETVQKKVNNLI